MCEAIKDVKKEKGLFWMRDWLVDKGFVLAYLMTAVTQNEYRNVADTIGHVMIGVPVLDSPCHANENMIRFKAWL